MRLTRLPSFPVFVVKTRGMFFFISTLTRERSAEAVFMAIGDADRKSPARNRGEAGQADAITTCGIVSQQ